MLSKLNVVIITEGSKQMGFGHIARCSAIYQAFNERQIEPLMIINGDSTINKILSVKNFLIFDWAKNESELFKFLNHAQVTIVDSYFINQITSDKIQELVTLPVFIDNFLKNKYSTGIIISPVLTGRNRSLYRKNPNVLHLIGLQYVILRKPFWDVSDKQVSEKIDSILITFGGSDIRNLTPKVTGLLVKNFPEIKKKVIIGKGFNNVDQIKSKIDKTCELIFWPDDEEMKNQMKNADLAISAGGQTLLELVRVGLPTIMVEIVENQRINIDLLNKDCLFEFAGSWHEKSLLGNIEKKIKLLQTKKERIKRAQKIAGLIDGQAARRIIDKIIERLN